MNTAEMDRMSRISRFIRYEDVTRHEAERLADEEIRRDEMMAWLMVKAIEWERTPAHV